MKKWFVASVAVFAIACGSVESRSRATGASSIDSAVVLQALRTDTLSEADGELYSPSYARIVLTRAGNTVAVDQDDNRLALFDTVGKLRRAVGRQGAGPGEFRIPVGIFLLPGDSIAIWDAGLRRISFFDDTLGFVRTEMMPKWNFLGGQSELVGRLDDGRWVARMIARAFDPNPEIGVRFTTDSAKLVAGRSDEAPVELVPLRPRRGVDLTAKMGSTGTNTYVLRLIELNLGIGAICERGVLTVDTSGVKEFDAGGKLLRSNRLPRVGDALRTAEDRKKLVDAQFYGALATDANAGKAHDMLDEIARAFSTRAATPILDAYGRLWYTRFDQRSMPTSREMGSTTPFQPRYVYEQLDSVGVALASVALPSNDPETRIADRAFALMRHSDSVGLTILRARAPEGLLTPKDQRLGRCASSFLF